jgi:glutathione synthase/RimK-type ligase-like ATP-grasp enzyme
MKRVALVKDRNRFWEIYRDLLTDYGHQVLLIDAFTDKGHKDLMTEKFDAFIWRSKHNPDIKALARRLIYFFDVEQGIPTFPSWKAYWHYDDKIAQYFIFERNGIPIPETHLFLNKEEAMAFADVASYPLVYKCAHGAGSANVGLLMNRRQARKYIGKAFGKGIRTYFRSELQRGYVLFQAFLGKNQGDYRLLCHGLTQMSGFFRHNRKDVPFASGNAQVELGPLPEDVLAFTADVHRKLGYDMMCYDILKDNEENWVITEMSVLYGDLSGPINRAPVYERTDDGRWLPPATCESLHERFILHLLQGWGWNE